MLYLVQPNLPFTSIIMIKIAMMVMMTIAAAQKTARFTPNLFSNQIPKFAILVFLGSKLFVIPPFFCLAKYLASEKRSYVSGIAPWRRSLNVFVFVIVFVIVFVFVFVFDKVTYWGVGWTARKHSLSLLVHLPDFICPKSNNNSKTKYFSFLFQK